MKMTKVYADLIQGYIKIETINLIYITKIFYKDEYFNLKAIRKIMRSFFPKNDRKLLLKL